MNRCLSCCDGEAVGATGLCQECLDAGANFQSFTDLIQANLELKSKIARFEAEIKPEGMSRVATEVGIRGIAVEPNTGELELELTVDGYVGRCFISPTFWVAIADMWNKSI